MRLKEKTKKTYLNYIDSYRKWCEIQKLNCDDPNTLSRFENKMHNSGRSPRYVKQCVGVIERHYELPSLGKPRKTASFTEEEMSTLFHFAEKNYQRDEICLVLCLMLKYDMTLSQVKQLTRYKIRQLVDELQNNDEESDVLNYVLSTTFDVPEEKILFRKTFSTYSANFKQRQRHLFPNRTARHFKQLKRFTKNIEFH
jgi:hypothetical protein